MNEVGWIAIVTAIAGVGGTGLGGLIGSAIKRDSSRVVSLFLSFAGGVMLCVVCCDLVAEAVEQVRGTSWGIVTLIGGIVLGYGVVSLLNVWIDRTTNREVDHTKGNHPRTADDLDELIHADHLKHHESDRPEVKSKNLFVAGVIMACAIALHNLPEGMVIGASYARGTFTTALSGSGLIMAVIIGLHNIPEGMAVSVPLISGGMKRVSSVLITALTGAPTIVGAILGYWLGALGPVWLCLSLAFASGAMLYVVFGELFPESILMWRSKIPAAAALLGVLVGLVIIYA